MSYYYRFIYYFLKKNTQRSTTHAIVAFYHINCDDYLLILPAHKVLTHWGRVTHICVSKLIIIGSDNGLSPGRRQAIIWTNAGIMSIGTLGTNFSAILIDILRLSLKKMRLKRSSSKWRLFCLDLKELRFRCPGDTWTYYRHGLPETIPIVFIFCHRFIYAWDPFIKIASI